MSDDQHDDEIIQRLRSALDEVVADPADTPAGDVPPPHDSFGARRWIAVAAALVLIGVATMVLVRHRGGDESTGASSTVRITVPSTSVPPSTSATPHSTLPSNDVGWYAFDLPWLTRGIPEFDRCCKPWPAPGPDLSMVWGDTRGIDHGVLLLRVHRSATGAPDTLTYSSVGLSTERQAALEKKVVPGSGLPYVLDDPSMQWLGNGFVADGNLVTQMWTNGGNTVGLSVGDYRGQLESFALHTGSVTATQIAGTTALRFDDDMGSTFVWRTPAGTWATLHVDIGLSKRLDEILANLHPAPVPTPEQYPGTTTTIFASATTYTARNVTIIDTGKGPMIAFTLFDSLPPQGGDVPLANLDWSTVPGEQTVSGVTWGGPYDVTGTWDGHTFTLTEPPVASTHTGPPAVPTHNSLTTGCTLEHMKPMLDALGTLDYHALGLLETGSYNWDGHCGVEVRAMFDTPEVRDAMAKVGTDVTLTFAFQPTTSG